jgi:hypothetical protein
MTSSEHADINRANAAHSTGPRTEEGKKKSSLNALRHGLTGQIVVMPADDLQAYRRHLETFTNEYHPAGATEEHLTQSLADTSWRLNRVAALESNLLSLGMGNSDDPIQNAMDIAQALESQTKALANLSMHTQRLSRQFERTVNQLRELQKVRKEQERIDLTENAQGQRTTLQPRRGWLRFFRPTNPSPRPVSPPRNPSPGSLQLRSLTQKALCVSVAVVSLVARGSNGGPDAYQILERRQQNAWYGIVGHHYCDRVRCLAHQAGLRRV